jgi:5'-nucleotidase
MKFTRRKFLSTALTSAGVAFAIMPKELSSLASVSVKALTAAAPLIKPAADETLITILHTNDVHSQIEPLPMNDKYAGKGGVARRATLVKRIRRENPFTLLIDAGDAFQGTPYFNLYKGEVEYKAMSAIGYDAVTLGNHDFDNGVEALANAMRFANFDFVCANYDVRGTTIENRVKHYVVRQLNGVRIGIFGLGINLVSYNAPELYKGVVYLDPVEASRNVVRVLRERENCALIVCASHLGYYPEPKAGEFGDTQLAAQVNGIDFIASGHTHTFMQEPVVAKQPSGKETVIFQVGKSGIYLGRVDFTVRRNEVTAHMGRLLNLREV